MQEKGREEGRIHKIKVKKPFLMNFKQTIKCPYCGNSEEFYEVVENATFYIHYFQKPDGTLEPLEEEVEVLGPARLFCAQCHAELTHLRR